MRTEARPSTSRGEAGEQTLEAEAVLVAIGFVPHTHGHEPRAAGVATERGFISIDDEMQTNVPGIYAIGDVTGKLMLAHVAMEQGVIAAEHIAGQHARRWTTCRCPGPRSASRRWAPSATPKQARKKPASTVKTGRFPLTALGKANAIGETEGFVKVVADEPTGQVLGIHMVGQM